MKKILLTLSISIGICSQNDTPDIYEHVLGSLVEKKENPSIAILEISSKISFKKSLDALKQIYENPNILGTVIIMPSYDHISLTSKLLYLHDELLSLKNVKPCVGYITRHCSAGAYYILSATDKILSSENIQLATPYVRWDVYKNKKPSTDYLIKPKVILAGKYKGFWEENAEFTQEHLDYLKKFVQDIYENACKQICKARNLNYENKDQWTLSTTLHEADSALENKLIDGIGSYLDAKRNLINLIKEQNSDLEIDEKINEFFFDIKKTEKENDKK